MISVAGLAKSTNGSPTAAGFIDQTAMGRIPYVSGTITYPSGTTRQNGTFSAPIGTAGQVTISPLTPGSANAVSATAANGLTASGTATMTQDGNFFYANLVSTTAGSAGERFFVFGGVPVSPSFYAATTANRFFAYTVNPDAALGSATSSQTIPFLPSNYGGAMPNATVSPLYLATIAGQPFGSFNATTNPNGAGEHYLQASLAVNGQGSNQSAALVVTTGSFSTSNTGAVVGAGPVRGTVFTSATGPLVHVQSASATVPDGNGNNLFGGNTLSGFVLDQNQYNNGNFSLNTAGATPFTPPSSTTFNYAFNQPVTAAALPSTVCVTAACRPQLNEFGFFGGIMQTSAGSKPGMPPVSYVLTGFNSVQTFPGANRVAATFGGVDPFLLQAGGVAALLLEFGAPSVPGINGYGRETYINNQNYAALENPNTPSQITLAGQSSPTSLPTYASGSNLYPRLALVTSGTVPNSWMPAGVTPCTCEFLQWGYWTGQVGTPNAAGTGFSRVDTAAINTWVAGQPTINLPTTGIGTYNGAAVGTVSNNGATYLAAGGFNQTYNFGTQTGSVNITNFDGASYTSKVSGNGQGTTNNLFSFTGGLTGPSNRNGTVIGRFYGPAAQETGGSFGVQSTAGPKYLASGIFAGKQIP